MKIELQTASDEDQETIQNLARFYLYDMSRYCGFLLNWPAPVNGLYECSTLSRYWSEPNRYPFLVRVDGEIAGFVLVNEEGTSLDVNWNMGEFFIVAKYQRKGIGKRVAEQIFDRFPGVWEVAQIPENESAVLFWRDVVGAYSGDRFEKSLKTIQEPKPHPMVVLKFQAPRESPEQLYQIHFKESASPQEEGVLLEGIIREAAKKGMSPIVPFAFFVKDPSGQIVAGVKGSCLYGCLYVDSLWVDEGLRKQGWGTKLIHDCEKLGRERQCTFVSLTTMDWEALPFYQKLGYGTEFVREGYENGSKMLVLRKELI